MKRMILLLCCLISLSLFGQAPAFEWATQIGGNSNDKGRGIATDHEGNVYVTGEFSDTADFDSGSGEHILISAGDYDVFVAKYNPNGQLLWVYSFGDIFYDTGAGISTDSMGNVYIVGHSSGTVDFDPGQDTFYLPYLGSAFILKLSTSGNFIWVKNIPASFNVTEGKPIAVDKGGSLYCTGEFIGIVDFHPGSGVFNLSSVTTDFDIFILKLDSNGDFLWAKSIGGDEWDSGLSIALDSANNVYTTGFFNDDADFDPSSEEFILEACNSQYGRDAFIVKLNSNGDFVWAKSIGDCFDDITSSGIVVSEAGEVYTTGWFEGTLDFDPGLEVFNLNAVWEFDIYILKLNTEGDFVWAKSIGSWYREGGNAIALDENNNIYTTGYFDGTVDFDPGVDVFNLTSDETDIFILKLDKDGNFVWAGGLIGNGGGIAGISGYAITLDDLDNIYTTGLFTETTDFDPDSSNYEFTAGGYSDIFIHKMRQHPCMSSPAISSNASFPICPGENIQLVVANFPASATNIFYNWNTGNNSDAILVSPDTSTIYSVAVTYNNDTTVCTNMVSIEIVVADPVAFSISEDLIICAEEEFVLEVDGGIAYQWSTGDSTNIVEITTSESQIYSVTVTDSNGCTGMDSVSVFVHTLSDTTYLELTNCDTSLVGLITYNYFDQNGCDSVVVENTVLIPIPEMPTAPADLLIQENAPPFSLVISEVLNATEYLWTVPASVQIISGQGTNSIIIDWSETTVSGSVCVSAINDCGSSIVDCMEVTVETIEGINNNFSENRKFIFPNPANEIINIVFEDVGNYEMELLNTLGEQSIIKKEFTGQTVIDLKNIPSGIYWLKLKATDINRLPEFVKIEVIK